MTKKMATANLSPMLIGRCCKLRDTRCKKKLAYSISVAYKLQIALLCINSGILKRSATYVNSSSFCAKKTSAPHQRFPPGFMLHSCRHFRRRCFFVESLLFCCVSWYLFPKITCFVFGGMESSERVFRGGGTLTGRYDRPTLLHILQLRFFSWD